MLSSLVKEMRKLAHITFGIIVLNGEPFTRYCLRAIYPFAHEIIVVEGACEKAAAIATPDGHSTDGTLKTLYRFKAEEDSENKVQIVVRNGFWSEKDEQSQAYAERATGDYLWQVDIDEFHKPENMETILKMLRNDPQITAVSFKQITFWGGFDYITDGWYLQSGAEIYHRVFRWGPGYRYITHRPPTVHDPQGRDLRQLKWLNGYELAKRSILLYHYSLVFPKQVVDKCSYYSNADWAAHARSASGWVRDNYLRLRNPFRVHNVYTYPSWLRRFRGSHPPAIRELIADIKTGKVEVELRPTDDVEKLLRSRYYQLRCNILRVLQPIDSWWRLSGVLLRHFTKKMRRLIGSAFVK